MSDNALKGEALKRRLRRGLLASAVFVLAGVGGAVGSHVTGKFTPAAVAFVVLLILGGLAALVLDRLSGDAAVQETHAGASASPIDARWARAVQVGDHNVQINQGDTPDPRRQGEP